MAHGDIEKYTKDAEDALAEASRKVDSGLPRSSYLANVGIANAILVLADVLGERKEEDDHS